MAEQLPSLTPLIFEKLGAEKRHQAW